MGRKDGHKRDRQTNVLISKNGKHFLGLWFDGRTRGIEWAGRGPGGSLTTMPRCSRQEQEQQEAALAEMTGVELGWVGVGWWVGKYGEYVRVWQKAIPKESKMPSRLDHWIIGSLERGGEKAWRKFPCVREPGILVYGLVMTSGPAKRGNRQRRFSLVNA
jgi:hypothetical protein